MDQQSSGINEIDQKKTELKDKKDKPKQTEKVKPPKGTRDFLPIQMNIRQTVFKLITSVFQSHGAVEIDTPVFELRETLMGKYGEEGGKLVYDINDQGGELLSLRYDLTVPFARFVASYGIKKIKRYHIGKVYRRDNPSIQQGRYREFFQCDFDIAGESDLMIADAELIKIIDTIFLKLDIGNYTIKISHRKLLDAMIQIAGIEEDKFKTVCSSIDKLDKQPWHEIQKELMEKKGLNIDQCAKLEQMVQLKGEPFQLLNKIKELKIFDNNQKAISALNEFELLFNYLKAMNVSNNTIIDLSLARGLDYYTGMIQETVLHGTQVGSVSGGGRYDDLIGMFSTTPVPSVGASIGIERIFAIIEKKMMDSKQIRENPSDCIVASIPSKNLDMTTEKLKIYDLLWKNGFKCDLHYKLNWNLGKQLTYANSQNIPFAIVFGEDEIKAGLVKIKNLEAKDEVSVELKDLPTILRQKLDESQKQKQVQV